MINYTAKNFIRALILWLTAAFKLNAYGQNEMNPENLYSPSAAMRFYEIAAENAGKEDIEKNEVQQGLLLMSAASMLDSQAGYILPDMINLATRFYEPDNSQLVYQILSNYVSASADMSVISKAVQYILNQQDTREKREEILMDMAQRLGQRNSAFASQVYTLLGLLSAEKADMEK